jgi:hypothetical protein
MPNRSRLLLAALTATVFLSLAVSAASARRFFFSATRYQAIWTLLIFGVEGAATVECPVTLEGSFHSSSISKISGALIGYVTSAKLRGGRAECLNTGTARINGETLPWHVRYRSFTGALPSITGISLQIVGGSWNIDPEGSLPNCNVTGTTAHPPTGTGVLTASGPSGNFNIRTVRGDEGTKIPVGGEFLCNFSPSEAIFTGTAELFVQGNISTRILVRLIQ